MRCRHIAEGYEIVGDPVVVMTVDYTAAPAVGRSTDAQDADCVQRG